MSLIESGIATVKINENGEKYWSIYTQDGKDESIFDPGQCLKFHPDAFEVRAEIKVFDVVE